MRHGSLFSGMGGFDLAADWMGWKNVFHCEINSFGRRILNYYWPNAISYEDITKTDFSIHRGTIDILTGGFPCQPYSQAGLRKGTEDERHLWPEKLRAIREIKPRWIVGENVLGLVNWNGGLVFEEIQADLEDEGYEVQPFILPACSTDAPHRRNRVWFVAYTNNERFTKFDVPGITEEKGWSNQLSYEQQLFASDSQSTNEQWDRLCEICRQRQVGGCSRKGIASDTSSERLESSGQTRIREHEEETGKGLDNRPQQYCTNATHSNGIGLWRQSDRARESRFINEESKGDYWRDFPTQPPVRSGDDGISSRLDGITFPKWRNESIKAAGNAIVPQVVHQIFKAIELYEQNIRPRP